MAYRFDPAARSFVEFSADEQAYLRRLSPANLNDFEQRQLVRHRRLARLDPNRPILLRTCAYVLMTSPEEVRRLLDDGHLVGRFAEHHWEFSVAEIREYLDRRGR